MARAITASRDDERIDAPLIGAFVIALALHLAAVGAMFLWRATPVATPPGQQEIVVDLEPMMQEIEATAPMSVEQAPPPAATLSEVQPSETPPVEAFVPPVAQIQPPIERTVPPVEQTETPPPVEQTEPPPPLDVPLPLEPPPPPLEPPPPVVANPLPPDVAPITSSAIEALALPPPPPPPPPVKKLVEKPPPPPPPKKVVERPQPQPKKPVERPAPAPTRAEPRQGPSQSAERPSASAASRSASSGSAAAGGDPNALGRWKAQIASALRGRLRFPAVAESTGAGGAATLRFTIARSGRVSGASIVRSAGHPALDQAALATAGGSLPAAPDGVGIDQMTVTVPLRFTR